MARSGDRMSDFSFRLMTTLFGILDFLFPHIERRVRGFGIRPGQTIIDYGCGPGRYAVWFSRFAGKDGTVYAVDIHELAIQAVQKRIAAQNIKNIVPVLAQGYESGLPDNTADVTCAIDMFFSVRQPTPFLQELRRITKKDGFLIIDDGHQPRAATIQKILASRAWIIQEETKDHLKCIPYGQSNP